MNICKLIPLGVLALVAASSIAAAATGWTERDLNLRTGPGTSYPKIIAIPAGARVEVVSCDGWCEVFYGSYHGWASARYISVGGFRPAPPPEIYWHFGHRPSWDDRYHAWHDGHEWWYDGRWHHRPRFGFYFEFGR